MIEVVSKMRSGGFNMNEVLNNLLTRRSVKKYKPDMLPREIIDQIIEAGTYAANGRGLQAPIIIAITNKEMRDTLSKLNAGIMNASTDPFYGAPVVLLVLADKNVPTYVYDGSLVIGNMMEAAHALGIGSCWIHRAKEEFEMPVGKAILKSLGIEGDYEGIGHCILGYPEVVPTTRAPRKENFVYYID